MTSPMRAGRDSTKVSPATHIVLATNLSPSNHWPFRYSVAGSPPPAGGVWQAATLRPRRSSACVAHRMGIVLSANGESGDQAINGAIERAAIRSELGPEPPGALKLDEAVGVRPQGQRHLVGVVL